MFARKGTRTTVSMQFVYFVAIVAFTAFTIYQTHVVLEQQSAVVGHLGGGKSKTLQDFAATARGRQDKSRVRIQNANEKLPQSTTRDQPEARQQQRQPQSKPTTVITWEGKEDLKPFALGIFKEKNLLCDIAKEHPNEHVLMNISFGCDYLYQNMGLGTGNLIAGFYAMRLAAQVLGNIDVSLSCPDAVEQQAQLILPWMTGTFTANPDGSEDLRTRMQDKTKDVCKVLDYCPIGYMYPQMQDELRRMAITLVGIPREDHPTKAAVWEWLAANQQASREQSSNKMQLPFPDTSVPPSYPDTVLDDAIVHIRCGDLMKSTHPRFGHLKFEAYAKRISADARSIGIVTQPFEASGQQRAWDDGDDKRERCRIVVTAFVDYLQERFPATRIRIHNDPDETIALTYARMIMANQSFVGISTFGVFPTIASFGTGYIRLPDEKSASNNWLKNPRLDGLMDGLVLMEEPNILMVGHMKDIWEESDGAAKILKWFRNSTLVYYWNRS